MVRLLAADAARAMNLAAVCLCVILRPVDARDYPVNIGTSERMDNKAAVELGKRRWAKLSAEEQAAQMARLKRAKKKLGKRKNSELARKAALARWAKYRQDKELGKG